MTLYGGMSIVPSIGTSNANYTSGTAKASDDGTHMPEYPTTVEVGGGGYSEGYAEPNRKEQDTAPKKESDGFYIPSFEDGESTPKWKEAEKQPLDVKALLGNQTPPSTFYTDDEGNISNTPNTKGGVYFGENALSPKTTAPKTKKQTATAALPEVSQIYTLDGDDYSFDPDAFAAAQRGTGEDQAAMSIAGGSGGGSKRNSNVNDAVFGGQSNSATPGYSLW